MGPFALPVPSWKLGQQYYRNKRRKIEEDVGAAGTSNEERRSPDEDISTTPTPSRLLSDSINPRSHSPDTLRQLAVAGLSPEVELPSQLYPNFPHQALPAEYYGPKATRGAGGGRRRRGRSRMSALTSGSEADADDTDASAVNGGSSGPGRQGKGGDRDDEDVLVQAAHASPARIRHLSTMMAILHRCLDAGDMPRARRAFSLLLQTRDVDVRLHGMWTLGTEILMRDGETRNDGRGRRQGGRAEGVGNDDDDDEDHGDGKDGDTARPPRWGATANMDEVRGYLLALIQQHPYDAKLPRVTSAADFWPALYNVEIYNAMAELRRALHHVDAEQDRLDDEQDGEDDEDEEEEDHDDENDNDEDAYDARLRRREARRRDARYAARDAVRGEGRVAVVQIAARMDATMETPPYGTHVELLRLRGLLALYVGDLGLPSRLLEEVQAGRNGDEEAQSREDREAWRRREEEIDRARGFFERLLEKGGTAEPRLLKFLELDEDDEGR
jgi:hypothetical protein